MLLQTLQRVAQNEPQRCVIDDGHIRLNARQLLDQSKTLATALRSRGIGKIALYADNSIAWVIADLACLQAEITLLPLPLFFSPAQIGHALQSSGIGHVLVARANRQAARMLNADDLGELPCDLNLFWVSSREISKTAAVELPEGTQKITFTSGSTGQPKGVCLSAEQQLDVAAALVEAVDRKPVKHLCLLPLSTLLENIGGIYAPLLAGGSILVPPLAEVGLEGSSGMHLPTLLATLTRLQPQSLILLPQLLAALLAAIDNGWSPPASLNFVAVGGGMVSPRLISRACELGLPVSQGYGLSECASVVCLNRESVGAPGSVGRPLRHVDVSINRGEIVVHGNVFLGYVGDPSSWYQSMVRTGDLGYRDEQGRIYINGRIKNIQISSFGRNVNPEWVESELLASPKLSQAVIFTEAKPFCVALIHPHDPGLGDGEIQALIDAANRRLPDYARILQWQRLPEKLSSAAGLLTDNGRPRRDAIYRHYSALLEHLYTQYDENPKYAIF